MITKKGQPITGTNVSMSNKRPFVPDAKETSADEETMIKEAPQPFKNRMTAAQMPTGRLNLKGLGIPYDVPSPVNARPLNLGTKVKAGTTAAMLAAVGEPRLPKGYNPVNSGYPTRGVSRTVGGGNTPRVTAKQRATYPGIFGSTKYRP